MTEYIVIGLIIIASNLCTYFGRRAHSYHRGWIDGFKHAKATQRDRIFSDIR